MAKLVLLQPVLLLLLLIFATSLNCLESNAIEWAELDKAQFISAAIQQFAVPKPSIPAGNVKEKMLFESAKTGGKLLVNLAKFPLMQVKLPKEKEPEDLRKLARNLGLVVDQDGSLNLEQIAKDLPGLVDKEDPRKLRAENEKKLSAEQKQFIAQMIKLHASGEGVEFARAKFDGKILMALNGGLAMKVRLEREEDRRRAVQVNLAVDQLTGELDLMDIYTNQMGKEDKRELLVLPMKRAKTVKRSANAEMASSTKKLAKKDGQEPEMKEESANATASMPEVEGSAGAKINKNGLRKVPEALPGKEPEDSVFLREFKLMKAKWQAQKEKAEETGGTNEE